MAAVHLFVNTTSHFTLSLIRILCHALICREDRNVTSGQLHRGLSYVNFHLCLFRVRCV